MPQTPTLASFRRIVVKVGSSLLIRRIRMDPAKVDENVEFFTLTYEAPLRVASRPAGL